MRVKVTARQCRSDRIRTIEATGWAVDVRCCPFSWCDPLRAGSCAWAFLELRHTGRGDSTPHDRMKRASRNECPKLARWKRAYGAKTILVLEQTTFQLTNKDIVGDVRPVGKGGRSPMNLSLLYRYAAAVARYPILMGHETLHGPFRRKSTMTVLERAKRTQPRRNAKGRRGDAKASGCPRGCRRTAQEGGGRANASARVRRMPEKIADSKVKKRGPVTCAGEISRPVPQPGI